MKNILLIQTLLLLFLGTKAQASTLPQPFYYVNGGLKPGIWVKKSQFKKASPTADYLYFQLEGTEGNYKISVPCDFETFDGKLKKKGDEYVSPEIGLEIQIDDNYVELFFGEGPLQDCVIYPEGSEMYVHLPNCKSPEHIVFHLYFAGNYKVGNSKVTLADNGTCKGFENFSQYRISTISNLPLLVFTHANGEETAFIAEFNGRNFDLFECLNPDEMFDLDAELKKGKKVHSFARN